MKLYELKKDKAAKKVATRVGRGGKRGTTSGRGQKGQKSRSGRKMRPAERDLLIRIPKLRGFRHSPVSDASLVLNLNDLDKKFKAGSKVSSIVEMESLKAVGLVPKRYGGKVKILGDGELSIPLTIKGLKISKSAKEKIEKAGGKIAE